MKKTQPQKPEQLEFDLVSPWLGDDPESDRLKNVSMRLAKLSEEKQSLASITRKLYREDLLGPLFTKPSNELAELKVLLGRPEFDKQQRTWKRRLKQNVVAVRKVIVCLKSLYNLQ